MKLTSLTVLLFLSAGGCGNSALSTQDMATHGSDLAVSVDLAAPKGDMTTPADMTYKGPATDGGPLMCGTTTCNKGEVCCVTPGAGGSTTAVCAASCADGGVSIACAGPGQCGGNPCCATIQGSTPSNVMCTTSMSACPPTFDPGTRSGMTRICNVDGDCTTGLSGQQMYPDCCHAPSNPSVHFCFSKTYAGFTQGAVVCP